MLQFQKPKNIGSLTSILLVLIKKKECTTAVMMVCHTIPGIDFTTVLVGSSGFTSQCTFIITIWPSWWYTVLVHEVITPEQGVHTTRVSYEKKQRVYLQVFILHVWSKYFNVPKGGVIGHKATKAMK